MGYCYHVGYRLVTVRTHGDFIVLHKWDTVIRLGTDLQQCTLIVTLYCCTNETLISGGAMTSSTNSMHSWRLYSAAHMGYCYHVVYRLATVVIHSDFIVLYK